MLYRPKRQVTLTTLPPTRGNRWARAYGIRVVMALAPQRRTLLIAGRPGTGKSNMLHALANLALKNEAIEGVACLSAAQFAEEIMRAALHGDRDDVLQRFVEEGLLAIDDVDRTIYQPEVADALVETILARQAKHRRTLLTMTEGLQPASAHPLVALLDQQPKVTLH